MSRVRVCASESKQYVKWQTDILLRLFPLDASALTIYTQNSIDSLRICVIVSVRVGKIATSLRFRFRNDNNVCCQYLLAKKNQDLGFCFQILIKPTNNHTNTCPLTYLHHIFAPRMEKERE